MGFRKEPGAQYLIFPKSLRSFLDMRVVAIDYGKFNGEIAGGESAAPPVASGVARSKRAQPQRGRSKALPAKMVLFPVDEKPAEPLAPVLSEKPKKKKRLKLTPALRAELNATLQEWEKGDSTDAQQRLRELLGE